MGRAAVAWLTPQCKVWQAGVRSQDLGGRRQVVYSLITRGSHMSVLPFPTPSFTRLPGQLLAVIFALAAGCTASEDKPSAQRERDSVIGASKLPGAAGVRGALRGADSAAARNARLDSTANDPY
jgi:hypothetical protein